MTTLWDGVLDRAECRDPGNSFVSSCRSFLADRGFLTVKQVRALQRVTETRSRQSSWGSFSHWTGGLDVDECYDIFGGDLP